jgi:threonine dehydrogenase-like Zn-dependent dehydrogenase
MRAVCWHGARDVRVERVPDPEILNPRDVILKVTSTAICGSDLHLYNGVIPTMRRGDILGHEFMGEVVEVGSAARSLAVGDRVVVPFAIACGACFFCREGLTSLCDNTNPNAQMAEALYGFSGSGLFGYSHLYGGYPGGQAQYVRVPFADVGAFRVPEQLRDEQVLFLSDILPTDTWRRRTVRSGPGTPSRSGGADRWACSQSRARTCWAPTGSSRSTGCRSGCGSPNPRPRRRRSTIRKRRTWWRS